MLLVADVHGAFDALREVAQRGEPLLVLGDLINFIDYRTNEGIAAEVFGDDFVAQITRFRATGDYRGSRRLWEEHTDGKREQVRALLVAKVDEQYAECRVALEGATAYVTFGNVDWPEKLRASLPKGVRFVDGEVVEIEGLRVGFAGGGAPTPVRGRGEVTDEEMAAKLQELGPVDVLCSHLPPAIPALYQDVITGRPERGSQPILEYLLRHQPAFHYFGDVHQPQAHRWRVGRTLCSNVGYFRATRRAVRHG